MTNKTVSRDCIWVCPHCGRTARNPLNFSDTACTLNAVFCYEDSLTYHGKGKGGIVVNVAEGGVVEPQPDKFPDEEE